MNHVIAKCGHSVIAVGMEGSIARERESEMCDACRESHQCKFVRAWIGPCGKTNCQEHSDSVCCSCGKPATHECDSTMGPLVCGCLICDECEHSLTEDGTTGFQFNHCKKTEQKFTPWYTR